MKTVELRQATEALSAYVHATAAGPVVVTDKGKVIAAMVRASDEDIEMLALGEAPHFMAIVCAARAEAQAGHVVPSEAARRELGVV